jgi:hypothetical protein
MKASTKKPTHWRLRAGVFLVPVIFWLIGLLISLVEQTAKGWSFFFAIMAVYTGGFAILYGCWLGCSWIFAKFKSRNE